MSRFNACKFAVCGALCLPSTWHPPGERSKVTSYAIATLLFALSILARQAIAQPAPILDDATYYTESKYRLWDHTDRRYIETDIVERSGPVTPGLQLNIHNDYQTSNTVAISQLGISLTGMLPIARVSGSARSFSDMSLVEVTAFSELSYSMMLRPLRDLELSELGIVANGVPINMVARQYVTASGWSGAIAHLSISGLYGAGLDLFCQYGELCEGREQLIGTNLSVTLNQVLQISVSAYGYSYAQGGYFPDAGFEAYSDPVFAIDPTFALRDAFALQYSENLFANSIPEPETYAMLLAGLGLLGWHARRRKLKEAAAA